MSGQASSVHTAAVEAALAMMEHWKIDPASELGQKLKEAVVELVTTMPPGFGEFDVVIRHEPVCACIRGEGDCDCDRWVTVGAVGLEGSKVTVH